MAQKNEASNNQVCIDANVLIDILLGRSRKKRALENIVNKDVFVSSESVLVAYYVISRDPRFDQVSFYDAIEKLHILNVDGYTIHNAKELANGRDLEDAVQVAAALQGNVTTFLTADKKLKEYYGEQLDIVLI